MPGYLKRVKRFKMKRQVGARLPSRVRWALVWSWNFILRAAGFECGSWRACYFCFQTFLYLLVSTSYMLVVVVRQRWEEGVGCFCEVSPGLG